MAIIPMRCTNCGANLEVNDTLEKGFCNYCGQVFLVAEALQRKQIIDESHKLAPLLDLAEAALESKEYAKCSEHCDEAILIDPKNHKAWYMKGCAAEGLKRGSGESYFAKAREYGGNYTYKPQAQTRKFRISIDKSSALIQPKVNFYVDKELVAQIKCGDIDVISISEGKHLISLKQKLAALMAWEKTIIVEDKDVALKLVWNKQKKGYDFYIDF